MILALAMLAAILPMPLLAQTAETPRAQQPQPQLQPTQPNAEAPARSRPRDPRDRAFMDGGMAITPGFSGGVLGGGVPAAPQAQLAPRANLDLEARPVVPSQSPSIRPTMIHPRVPGRGALADTVPTHPDQRFLQTPAPGARLSVPLTW